MSRKLVVILHADVVGSTRLVQQNEPLAHNRIQEAFSRFSETIKSYSGKTHELRGDALVAEFERASDAVTAALAFQSANKEFTARLTDEIRPQVRIGISLGEVVIADNTITGAGVVLAQRLEQLAEPGGICIQGAVRETVPQRLPFEYESLGEQQVKGFDEPVRAHAVRLKQDQSIPEPEAGVETLDSASGSISTAVQDDVPQEIRYCTSPDGTPLAYSVVGTGQPMLKAAHFMTHLEHDWSSPTFGPFFHEMSARYSFIRYDQRGNGLSERHPTGFSSDAFVQDFEAVADAAGVERFAIYGLSQGSMVAIDYAVRHPERVSGLILHGGFARGRYRRGKLSVDDRMRIDALITLVRTGWGQDNPAFRQMFSTMFIPEARADMMDAFNEIMRISTDPDVAAQIFEVVFQQDLSDILHRVQAPTLILHGSRDTVSPIEEGRRLAAGIPNAKLVELDTANHLPVRYEPVWPRMIDEINRFMSENPA